MISSRPPINVLAIDPGNNMGVCVATINTVDLTLQVHDVHTLVLDRLIRVDSSERQHALTKRELMANRLSKHLIELFDSYDFDVVVVEAAYNSRSIVAYEALLFYQRIIKETCYRLNYDLLIDTITPSSVKKMIGVTGNSGDKDLITKAVMENPDIKLPKGLDTNILTEHGWDSIAIANTILVDFKTTQQARGKI